jgi:hypothetical protein
VPLDNGPRATIGSSMTGLTQVYAMGNPVAERICELGGTMLGTIGRIARTQRISDNDAN